MSLERPGRREPPIPPPRALEVRPLRENSPARDRTDHPVRARQYIYEQRTARDAEWNSSVRTSAAAVSALVLGVCALLAVATIVLMPLALLLAGAGIVLGLAGIRTARQVGVTGRDVAVCGLVLSALALVLAIAITAGATTILNNRAAVDRIDRQVQKLKHDLPSPSIAPGK